MNEVLRLILESPAMIDGDRIRIDLGTRFGRFAKLFPALVTCIWFLCEGKWRSLLELNGPEHINAQFTIWISGKELFVRSPVGKTVNVTIDHASPEDGVLKISVKGDKVTITDVTRETAAAPEV